MNNPEADRLHQRLIRLNGGRGRYNLVRKALAKMDTGEAKEFGQLLLSIESEQNSLQRKSKFPRFVR